MMETDAMSTILTEFMALYEVLPLDTTDETMSWPLGRCNGTWKWCARLHENCAPSSSGAIQIWKFLINKNFPAAPQFSRNKPE